MTCLLVLRKRRFWDFAQSCSLIEINWVLDFAKLNLKCSETEVGLAYMFKNLQSSLLLWPKWDSVFFPFFYD